VTSADIERMADRTLLTYGAAQGAKQSAFWVLLALAAVIASAGIVADSTATVIGAMIVAPLMTPILGTAFALVLADRQRMWRSLGFVVLGALLVVAIGFTLAVLEPLDTVAEGNSQVASRVHPRLIDLVAALATGSVGAFALVRSDVSDALPGVAIAISLVPPLAVVGVTLEAGRYQDAFGALLLFLTNVTAIVLTATLGLLLYRVRQTAQDSGFPVGTLGGRTLLAEVAVLAVIVIPLVAGSQQVARDNVAKFDAAPIVDAWAADNGWTVIGYLVHDGVMTVTAVGAPPRLSPEDLRQQLDAAGYSDLDLEVELVLGGVESLPGTGG
jgi:uncharacterized hydrophobic protein (TIGR00271 family)